MKISVILPSLNPDEKLMMVVDGLIAEGFDDIIIVNDGSDENHMEPFRQAACHKEVTVLKHEVNRGKGCALKTAYKYCIENISREANPRLIHQNEHVAEVFDRGINHKETRRKYEQFVQRLQGLGNGVYQRHNHYYSNDSQHYKDTDIASLGAVDRTSELSFVTQSSVSVVNVFFFHLLKRHITYLPF